MAYIGTKTARGKKYYQLLESFRDEEGKVKKRILYSYGASDPREFTHKALKAKVQNAFPQIGSKARLSKHLFDLCKNIEFSEYIEPFVGTGAIYFTLAWGGLLDGCGIRILNDKSKLITNFYQQAAKNPQQLAKLISETAYHPDEAVLPAKAEGLEAARQFAAYMYLTFAGSASSKTFSKENSPERQRETKWFLASMKVSLLLEAYLETATIFNKDAMNCLEQFQSDRALIIVDPPYLGHEKDYLECFDQHSYMAEFLVDCKAREILVCAQDCEQIRQLYPKQFWMYHEISHTNSSAHSKTGSKKSRATELILQRR